MCAPSSSARDSGTTASPALRALSFSETASAADKLALPPTGNRPHAMSSETPPSALAQLNALQQALQQMAANPGTATRLSAIAREQAQLLAALPPRYGEVLLGLLDRLESSALFSEESCSFSQKDLVDSLRLWVDKARELIDKG